MKKYTLIAALMAILALSACSSSQTIKDTKNTGDTISLFDGKTLNGWHLFNQPGKIANWKVENGAMVCLGAALDAHGGDLLSDAVFSNFELSWEWKVDKGSNSGVMYHVVEDTKYEAPYQTGPEYQIIDDIGFPQQLEPWQMAGADYAMYIPNNKKQLNPVGEWNSSKIIYNNGKVEHWLNGQKILQFDRNSEDWKQKRINGKWKDFPDYAKATSGHIALQDHGQKVWYRNITVKPL